MFGREQLKMKHESVKEGSGVTESQEKRTVYEVMTKRCKNYFISK